MAVLRNLYPPSQEPEWDDGPTVGAVKYGLGQKISRVIISAVTKIE